MELSVNLERYLVNLMSGSVTNLTLVSLNKLGEVVTTNILQLTRKNTNPYTQSGISTFHQNSKAENYVTPSDYIVIKLIEVGKTTDVKLGFINAYTKILDKVSHAKTTYRNALEDPYFRIIYNYAERDVLFMDNNVPIQRRLLSGPCMRCGIILPWDYLTIDHQQPQSTGEISAILKAFRACGLTQEGPKGHKGQQLRNHLTMGALLTAIPTKYNRAPTVSGDKDQRNTLSTDGSIIYTLLKAAGMVGHLRVSCMNSLMNLAPLCLHCNSSKSNK